MAAPNKAERQKCWQARDEFWKCLDECDDNRTKCKTQRSAFEASCTAQWVKYFDRRREFLKFKEKMDKEGFDPVADTDNSTAS